MDAAPVFQVAGLSVEHRVGDRPELLIEDFRVEAERGEIVGLVGETGGGKSLSVLASVGLLPRNLRVVSGSVRFDGVEIAASDSRRLRERLGRGICLLFQNARGALNPYMRARAQVERALKLRGVRARDRDSRATELFEAVGLSARELGRKYPHEMSGGQAQRVAMAIALATEPAVLIADEPTTALDVTTERELTRLLQRLCRERDMALVLITHNLALVSNLCERVTLMHAGHVVEEAPVETIFSHPLHPYTAGLIRAIPDIDEVRELRPMAGSVPAAGALGPGCRFADRCEHVTDRCRAGVPSLFEHETHCVRCVLYDPERSRLPA